MAVVLVIMMTRPFSPSMIRHSRSQYGSIYRDHEQDDDNGDDDDGDGDDDGGDDVDGDDDGDDNDDIEEA